MTQNDFLVCVSVRKGPKNKLKEKLEPLLLTACPLLIFFFFFFYWWWSRAAWRFGNGVLLVLQKFGSGFLLLRKLYSVFNARNRNDEQYVHGACACAKQPTDWIGSAGWSFFSFLENNFKCKIIVGFAPFISPPRRRRTVQNDFF